MSGLCKEQYGQLQETRAALESSRGPQGKQPLPGVRGQELSVFGERKSQEEQKAVSEQRESRGVEPKETTVLGIQDGHLKHVSGSNLDFLSQGYDTTFHSRAWSRHSF